MKKQLLTYLSFLFLFSNTLSAQNSYKEKETLKWYSNALLAFESENYHLAATYFNKAELDDYRQQTIKEYQLLIGLEINEYKAGTKMETYLNENPFTTNKNNLILALSNYYFNIKQESKALKWFAKIDVKELTKKQETNYNYKLAFANYTRKNYSKAKQYLLALTKSNEYKNQAFYYLGNIAMENKEYNEALSYFEKLKNQPQYKKELAYQNLVILYHQKEYKKAIALGELNFKKTRGVEQSQMAKIIGESYFYEEDYTKALTYLLQYKGNSRAGLSEVDYYFIGYAYYMSNDFNKAIENFNKITNQKTAVSQNAHYHLGDCYLKKNQKNAALNAFKNASEMDFDLEIKQDAFLNYAKLSYEIGNPYKSASEVLQDYVEAYPNSTETPYIEKLIVNAYLQFKDYTGAINYYRNQRLVKDQLYQLLLLEKGFELYNSKNYESAVKHFSEAANMYTNDEIKNRALFWKAETLAEMNEFKEAEYVYRLFVGSNKNNVLNEYADGFYGMAYALYQQKKYDKAIVSFKDYLDHSNDDEKRRNALLRIADCYFVSKKYWPALENYNLIINENKEQVDYAMYQKALAYGFLGRNEKKIEALKMLQSSFKTSAYLDDSYYQLGNLYVNIRQSNLGIEAYNQLENNYPKSPLVAKAKLKKGIVMFNQNENEAALKVLKQLVAQYPGTAEAVQAVKTAEQVYKDMDQVNEYAAWVKQLEFVNITDSDIDKTMFEAAENKYLSNDLGGAITSCKKYLAGFPNGIYALTVHFYLAQSYYNIGAKERAVPEYIEVLKVNTNEYTEVSLNRLSQIYLENENWEQASPLLLQIEKEASNVESVVYAQSNLMKYYYKTDEHEKVLSYTEKVLQNPKSSQEAIADAYVFGARSSVLLKNYPKAKSFYSKLETIGKGEVKAEANYYKALWLYQDKKYVASNEQIQLLTRKYQSYKYWGIKGLLLMAKNYHELQDDFQANFILENLFKNAKKYNDIMEEVVVLLEKYKADKEQSLEENNSVEQK